MNNEAENNLSYIASELYHTAQGFEDFPKKLQPPAEANREYAMLVSRMIFLVNQLNLIADVLYPENVDLTEEC